MRRMLSLIGLAVAAHAAGAVAALAQPAPVAGDRPNVLVVFTDDQRYDAAGFTGNAAIYTPHLDRIARQGVVFDNCFVNTSICAVSRANLMMGQYPARHGVTDFFQVLDDRQMQAAFPSRLRDAGYYTGLIGKWGIGDSIDATHRAATFFDYWGGASHQTNYLHEADCRYVAYDGVSRPIDDTCDCPADSRGVAGPHVRIGRDGLQGEVLHVDMDVAPMKARDFLDARDAHGEGKPFALVVEFKAPHSPFGDWDLSMEDRYNGLFLPRPPTATPAVAEAEPDVVKTSLGGPGGRRMVEDAVRLQQHLQDYYRQVSSMDAGFGKIIDELERRGELDNTVVFFTSDNGFMNGDHGTVEKWLMYEPSLRVPGFVADMRSPREHVKRVPQLVTTIDFTASILDAAGLEVPPDVTGMSFMPALAGELEDWRDDFYYQQPYTHKGALPYTTGVRGERWVYTKYGEATPVVEQLFDLHADPMQLDNLIDDPAHAADAEAMRKRYEELKQQVQ